MEQKFTIILTKLQIDNAKAFLDRVTLNGKDAIPLFQIVQALAEAKPVPTLPKQKEVQGEPDYHDEDKDEDK